MQITLKAARANANMTQAEIAEKMGVSIGTVSLWEKGKVDLSAKQLMKYCQIVGATANDIFLPDDFN